jgi:hypothetical protein
MELVEDAAEAVASERAGALVDVPVEQRPDASPERRHELDPRLVHARHEQIPCLPGIRQERIDEPAVLLVLHRLAATLELPCDLRRRGRADLGELVAQAGPGRPRRGRQEVRRPPSPRLDGEERSKVEAPDALADELVPQTVMRAGAPVGERAHCGLRLPDGRTGKPHRQKILRRPKRIQRHPRRRYAQTRINCGPGSPHQAYRT